MNFKKILASVAAAALAVSSMAVCSFAASTPIATITTGAKYESATDVFGQDDSLTTVDKVVYNVTLTNGNSGWANGQIYFNIGQEGAQFEDYVVKYCDSTASSPSDDQIKLTVGVATDLTLEFPGDKTINQYWYQLTIEEYGEGTLELNSVTLYSGADVVLTYPEAVSGGDDGGDDTDSESNEPNYDIPDRPAEDTSAATEATSAPEETTTEEEAAPEAGTFKGSHTMSDTSWWTQDVIVDVENGVGLENLIGDLDPATVTSITFTCDTTFVIGYNTAAGEWFQCDNAGVTEYTMTDFNFNPTEDNNSYLHLCLSKGDGVEYTINWVVTTGDAPATTEDTSASEAAPEDTSETSVVVEPGPVETTSEETNAGNSEDGNQPTGIVLAVIPAAAAVAGVIVSRKRS